MSIEHMIEHIRWQCRQSRERDLPAFERELERRASQMTISQLDAALCELPATPKTDQDLLVRAAYVRRRGELLNEANRPAPPPILAGVIAIAPDGVDCVQRKDGLGYCYVEMIDGQNMIKLDWPTFAALVRSGGMWATLNQNLLPQLNSFSL
jgi:hypothetical protein